MRSTTTAPETGRIEHPSGRGTVADIVERILRCLPETNPPIPLHEPAFEGNEWAYVKECLDTGWVSSAGAYVAEFECRIADYVGVAHAVAVMNGTAALHIALKLAGVRRHDEVLVPALTFVATANAVRYCRATPHFVDGERATLGVGAHALRDYLRDIGRVDAGVCMNRETGRPIRALVPMHTFGHPVDLDGLETVCDEFALVLVEDAAESLGSTYKRSHTGSRGLISALSFNGNKIITTGGGGVVLTDDPALAAEARHLTTTARVPHPWAYEHDRVGYNFRMPNLNAALGCGQLERLPEFIADKRRLAERYRRAFEDLPGVAFVKEPAHSRSNYWLNAILLEGPTAALRDEVLAVTNEAGVLTRPAWTLLNRLPMYADCPSMPLRVAEELERGLINLPSSAWLGRERSRDA